MKTTSISKLKNQKPKVDPHYPAAVQRANEAAQRLREAGIIDAEGRRIRKDLPPEMANEQSRLSSDPDSRRSMLL